MMSNSKVLTVSYGTFSCTLEGFEESFETMKAIAEYFRDLAAEDRYFGAEPPQPDAEMLARIAEREASRTVRARQSDGQIVLSATPVNADAPASVPSTDINSETTDHVPADVPSAIELEQPLAENNQSDSADLAPGETEDASARNTQPEAEETEVQDVLPLAAVATAATGVAITDKLARIRAVVSSDDADGTDTSEVEALEESLPDDTEHPAETLLVEADAANDEQADIEEMAEPVAETEISTPISNAELTAEDTEAEAPEEENTRVAPEPEGPEEAANVSSTPPASIEPTRVETALEEDIDEGKSSISDVLAQLGAEEINDEELEEEATAEVDTTEPSAPLELIPASQRARIVKMKRTDLEAAINSGNLEEVVTSETEANSTLSAEDEADLQNQLAAVEDSIRLAQAESFETSDDSLDTAHQEPDLDRLIAEADAQMDVPENSNNRQAFAHLRAAVAAKHSDDEIGQTAQPEQEGLYKTDLDDVVRPRRPEPRAATPTERPQSRPAPLKLVAEQRIDTPSPATNAAASAQHTTNEPKPQSDFVQYASDVGAHALPQILEAAVAYLAFVEERDSFSRPQIMNRVRMVKGDDFNREDGLRSFGQLLRAGKVERLNGGRFTATSDTGFKPERRAAG